MSRHIPYRVWLSLIGASLGTVVLCSSPAHGQTLDVEFSGNIAPITSIETLQETVPVPTSSEGNSPGLPTIIETLEPTIIRIQTSGPLSVIASEPIPRGIAAPDGSQYTSILSDGNSEVTNGTPLLIDEVGDVDLSVGIRVESPSPLPPGQYNYDVVLTLMAL